MRAALSKKEHRIIREGLVAQGCTWRESAHNFLFTTPDGQTVGVAKTASDFRSNKNARADVRRAGLRWPLDPPPPPTRKEKPVPVAESTESLLIPVQIQRQTYAPTRVAAERIMPFAEAMPDRFWTHELLAVLRENAVPGFANGSGNSRLIVLLWHQGYRPITAVPERGGQRYRWRHDPDAVIPPYGQEGDVSAKVTPISAQVEKPVDEVRTHPEYDRGLEEGMAAAEDEIAALKRQVEQQQAYIAEGNRASAKLDSEWQTKFVAQARQVAAAERARDEAESARQRLVIEVGDAAAERSTMERELERWKRSADSQAALVVREPSPAGNDNSWVLSEDEIGDQSLTALQRAGRSFGLRIEVRARRA